MADALPLGLTEEQLRAAVAASRSWRGVLRSVGSTSAHRARQLRTACDELGIDYRHFGGRTWTDDALRAALTHATTWPDLLERLGFAAATGSARAAVRRHAARLGLDLSVLTELHGPRAEAFLAPPELQHLRTAGAYVVAAACAVRGYRVSWPLEPAVYDLVVDTGELLRVQVKTTTVAADGTWVCSLTHAARSRRAWYTSDQIDCFGVVDPHLDVYMIPVPVVDGRANIYLRRYEAYRLQRRWGGEDSLVG